MNSKKKPTNQPARKPVPLDDVVKRLLESPPKPKSGIAGRKAKGGG